MTIEEAFSRMMQDCGNDCHGSQLISQLASLLQAEKKKVCEQFFSSILYQQPVKWEDEKKRVWNDENDQKNNEFSFLQGDIIDTTMVISPGIAESDITISNWLVLAPDCDAVRAEFVRVAPVYGTDQNYSSSLKLKSPKLFPVVSKTLLGYADLITPCYIVKKYKNLATVRYSMQVNGWHFLNAFLQNRETRANIEEAVKIRSRLPYASKTAPEEAEQA